MAEAESGASAAAIASAGGAPVPPVQALFFDVFGTLVDWRGSIAREAPPIVAEMPGVPPLDGEAFADAWRAEYQTGMEPIRAGRMGYVKLDEIHLDNLDRIAGRFGLAEAGGDVRRRLNGLWHRLAAWPDVEFGLSRLKRRFKLAPCSNGHIGLMVDLARRNGFVWDAVLGAEIARDYKPKAAVYLAAASAFDLEPENCMMVAAHSDDLAAAAACGLRTAHVARPDEFGPGLGEKGPSVPVDLSVGSLIELAERLGA